MMTTSSRLTISPFLQGIPTVEETELPLIPPKNIWERIAAVLF